MGVGYRLTKKEGEGKEEGRDEERKEGDDTKRSQATIRLTRFLG